MNLHVSEVRSRRLLAFAAAGVIATVVQGSAQAANIFLQADDAAGASSFTSATNWSPAQVPGSTAGDDYYAATAITGGTAHSIRTPSGGGATTTYTFGDITKDKLHLVSGSALRLKSSGGTTISAALVMNSGSSITTDAAGGNYFLTGNLTVNASVANPAQINAVSNTTGPRFLTINSAISGSGDLKFVRGGATGGISIAREGNLYTGNATIEGTNLTLAKDLALGTANITMTTLTTVTPPATFNPSLTLSGGTTNNYIADTASLTVPTGGVVNLNFTGTDNIASLTIAGTTYNSGVFGFGATNPGGVFTGSGFIAVPEPATLGLLSLAGLVLMRRRNG